MLNADYNTTVVVVIGDGMLLCQYKHRQNSGSNITMNQISNNSYHIFIMIAVISISNVWQHFRTSLLQYNYVEVIPILPFSLTYTKSASIK